MKPLHYFIISLIAAVSMTSPLLAKDFLANDFVSLHNSTDCYLTDQGYKPGIGGTVVTYQFDVDTPQLAKPYSQILLHEVGMASLLASGDKQQGILIGGENDSPHTTFYDYSANVSYILTDVSSAHGCSLKMPCYILSPTNPCGK